MNADETTLNDISRIEEVIIADISKFPFAQSHTASGLLTRYIIQMEKWINANFNTPTIVISAHIWARPASGLYTFRMIHYYPYLLEDNASLYEASYQAYRLPGEPLTLIEDRPICSIFQYDQLGEGEFSDEYVPLFMLK